MAMRKDKCRKEVSVSTIVATFRRIDVSILVRIDVHLDRIYHAKD